METLIHADIFFFITTLAVIVLTALGIFALVYTVQILHDIRELSRKFKKESEELLGDIHEWRENIKQEGVGIRTLGKFFGKLFKKRKR